MIKMNKQSWTVDVIYIISTFIKVGQKQADGQSGQFQEYSMTQGTLTKWAWLEKNRSRPMRIWVCDTVTVGVLSSNCPWRNSCYPGEFNHSLYHSFWEAKTYRTGQAWVIVSLSSEDSESHQPTRHWISFLYILSIRTSEGVDIWADWRLGLLVYSPFRDGHYS